MGIIDRLFGRQHPLQPRTRPILQGSRPGVSLMARSQSRSQLRASPTLSEAAAGWTIVRGDQPTQYQTRGRNVRVEGWERHPIVNACARVIVDHISLPPLEVYRLDKSGEARIIEDRNDPLVALLREPRVTMNPHRLMGLTALHYVLYGNAFWHLERPGVEFVSPGDALNPGGVIAQTSNELPTGLRLVHPEHILYAFLDVETLEVLQWQWRDRMGRVHYSRAEDMVHFPDWNAYDWIFGYPRAAAALNDIVGDNEASQYVREIVTNDGTPTLIFMLDGEMLPPEEQVSAKQRWQETRVTRGNRGQAEFMGGLKDVKALGFNLRELEFPQLRQVARTDICTSFGVDPVMIGLEHLHAGASRGISIGGGGTAFTEARFRLIHQTVLPLMRSFEAQMNLWLAREFGERYIRFSPEGIDDLTESDEQEVSRTTKLVGSGIMSLEEARPLVGLDPDPTPGDTFAAMSTIQYLAGSDLLATSEHNQEMNAVELKNAKNPPEPPAPVGPPKAPTPTGGGGGGNNGKKPDNSDHGSSDQRRQEVLSALRDLTVPVATPESLEHYARARSTMLTPDQRNAYWRMTEIRATRDDSRFQKTAEALLDAERRVVHALLTGAPSYAAAIRLLSASYGPDGEFWKAWVDAYRPILEQTMNATAQYLAGNLGVEDGVRSPRLEAAIWQRSTRLSTQMTQTTWSQVHAVLQVGRASGQKIEQIADILDHTVFGAMASDRAEAMGKAEAFGALNQAQYEAAVASGVVVRKEWLTPTGELHNRDLDGQQVGIEEPFANGMLYPGDSTHPINAACRCIALYHETPAARDRHPRPQIIKVEMPQSHTPKPEIVVNVAPPSVNVEVPVAQPQITIEAPQPQLPAPHDIRVHITPTPAPDMTFNLAPVQVPDVTVNIAPTPTPNNTFNLHPAPSPDMTLNLKQPDVTLNLRQPDMTLNLKQPDNTFNLHPAPSPDMTFHLEQAPPPDMTFNLHPAPSPDMTFHLEQAPPPDMTFHLEQAPAPDLTLNLHPAPIPDTTFNLHPAPSPDMTLNLHPAPSPDVTLYLHPGQAPNTTFNLHPTPSPDVTLNLRQPDMTLNLQAPPSPDVNIQIAPAPQPDVMVNIAPPSQPDVTVNIAPTPTPDVTVNVAPPMINIEAPAPMLPPSPPILIELPAQQAPQPMVIEMPQSTPQTIRVEMPTPEPPEPRKPSVKKRKKVTLIRDPDGTLSGAEVQEMGAPKRLTFKRNALGELEGADVEELGITKHVAFKRNKKKEVTGAEVMEEENPDP